MINSVFQREKERRMVFVRSFIMIVLELGSLAALALSGQGQEDKILHLQIGAPQYKTKVLDIVPDEIVSVKKGKPVTFARMIRDMKTSRFVYVGETHDSLPMHEIQFRVIQALYQQDPKLALGMEMFPSTLQEVLDRWTQGVLSREEFIRQTQWYITWNFNFGFYEKLFQFAKENRIPVYALNAPREVIAKIRMKGWEALTEEEKNLAPEPDLSNEEHKLYVRKIFETMEMPPQMKGPGLEMVFEGLYRAQSAWDEVMAANALKGAGEEGRRLVVLAGSGHLLYNLGINRRVSEKKKLPMSTLIALAVPEDRKSIRVQRSLGDFIWGIEEEEKPAFPSIGLNYKEFEGLENLVVPQKPTDGVAKGADFEKGDVILSVNGKLFSDINELRMYLAGFNWGDETVFRILRGGEVKVVVLKFVTPEPAEDKKRP